MLADIYNPSDKEEEIKQEEIQVWGWMLTDKPA